MTKSDSEFPETRASLLLQLQAGVDQDGWQDFVAIYRPIIYRLARKRGLQDADAQDLAQQVLVSIAGAIERWHPHDESTRFRHWLRRVARNAIFNALTRRPRDMAAGGTSIQDVLERQGERDSDLSREIELEHRRELFLKAASIAKTEVSADTWQVFQLTVIEGCPIEEAASRMSKSVGATEWQKQNVVLEDGTDANQLAKDQEAHLLDIYKPQFIKARQILREGPVQGPTVQGEPRNARGNLAGKEWRTDLVAFEKYLRELAAKGRVPDEPALAKRVTLIPGGRELNSEVFPVTDGAGGFIDTRPANDTVQFRVNEALKGKKISWEFELERDATESHTGVVCLVPKIADDDDAVPFLSSVFVKPAEGQASTLVFNAGEILKLEGAIGDFAGNEGIAVLQSPSGPVAIYHLDSAPHTVFWIGLTDVTIASPNRTTTTPRLEPSADVAAIAKSLLRASFRYDEKAFNEIYASEVRLLPGNRLFQYGLELPGKTTSFGVVVDRDKMLPALRKQADRDPVPEPLVAAIVNLFRIEQMDVSAGEFVAEPNQPGESVFDKLRFTIQENDVLLKVSVPTAFRYLQLRKLGDQWKVVVEY